jgi:hypothetical protein
MERDIVSHGRLCRQQRVIRARALSEMQAKGASVFHIRDGKVTRQV